MYAALAEYKLPTAPGTHYLYSNFDFGLLGHVLSRSAGVRYEDLVVSRICAPLGMDCTRITLTPSTRARRAPGHNAQLQTIESWGDSPAFEAAGAFSSTANDLLKFLGAATGRAPSSLTLAFAALLKPRVPIKSINFPNMSVASRDESASSTPQRHSWRQPHGARRSHT